MQTFISTLSCLSVLICATLKSKAESKFTGTEGGSVDIFCKYSDGYQYTPMYFCRDPCAYSDLLIKCKKADTFVSKGRYSAINTVSGRRFSVAIKNLTLQDSGVYYCGVDTWGFDKLTKVKLTVSKVVPAVSTFAPVSGEIQMSEVTELPITITVLSPTALVVLYIKTSYTGTTSCCLQHTPETQIPHSQSNQEDLWHVNNEMLDVYSSAGLDIGDDPSAPCSTFQHTAPADNDCNPYSLGSPQRIIRLHTTLSSTSGRGGEQANDVCRRERGVAALSARRSGEQRRTVSPAAELSLSVKLPSNV
ncbi:CMRF35-like molecule 9 [Silurus meridionalis]|uniref:CMRF35-like molecule 9 n=1 Tax=Silurus meridionalis TaxID=175797 RepID=UPI001EEBEB80|nr:CMRF35-like molecule 9 [Silurus meridionalis]